MFQCCLSPLARSCLFFLDRFFVCRENADRGTVFLHAGEKCIIPFMCLAQKNEGSNLGLVCPLGESFLGGEPKMCLQEKKDRVQGKIADVRVRGLLRKKEH